MDEEIDRLVVRVRADTQGFARDVADMRSQIEGPLGDGAGKAGKRIEDALTRAVKSGKLGFDELKAVALQALDDIAAAAGSGGSGSGGSSIEAGLLTALGSLFAGAPGRATGGPVSPGRPYWVGERGPELFVPTAAGQVAPVGASGARDVRVAITVNAAADAAPRALQQSSRQVARAVKAALAGVD